jgi:hypothetical protein
MRVDRVDAAMAIRPYIVPALKREFLSRGSIISFRRNSSRSTSSATNSAVKVSFASPHTVMP